MAAIHGRKVTFRWLALGASHEVTGYVTGMDDYHWMVAIVRPHDERKQGEEPLSLALVHKSRVDMLMLHAESSIDSEDEAAQSALHRIGGKFWRYCEATYNNGR